MSRLRRIVPAAMALAQKAPRLVAPLYHLPLRVLGRPRTARFFDYAIEFERAYESDAWGDVERYFTPEAVYEVRGTPFDCRLEGSRAVVAGIRRCLDSFDRRLDRKLWIAEGPVETGDEVSFLWRGKYSRTGAPPLRLEARQRAVYDGRRIAKLSDTYSPGVGEAIEEWLERHGADLDPSYV